MKLLRNSTILLIILSVVGLLARFYLVTFGRDSGDLLVFEEWGRRFWDLGPLKFYLDEGWLYSFPTYPPLSSLMYGGLYWLFDHKYFLAQLHNLIKIPPSAFIVYFYDYGYTFLLKLPSILADLGIGLLVYKMVKDLTGKENKAIWAFALFFLNPLTIFLAGVWGQTESFIAFFGLASFYLLSKEKYWASVPLLFVSLFLKPTWVVFLPIYAIVLLVKKANIKGILVGVAISAIIFWISTAPFSGEKVIEFTRNIVLENMLPAAKGGARTSISAFNFYTIFHRIDFVLVDKPLFLISSKTFGLVAYILLNLITLKIVKRKKGDLKSLLFSIFVIGIGTFIFTTNMLERYFFAGFAPLIVLMVLDRKALGLGLLLNAGLLANLVWAFYRRKLGWLDHIFTDNNFLVIKLLSILNVFSFASLMIKLGRGKS